MWRRHLVVAAAALASFVLAGAMLEIALTGNDHRRVPRLPFAATDAALAAAGLFVLLGLGVLLSAAGRR